MSKNTVFLVDDDQDDIDILSMAIVELYPETVIQAFNDGQWVIDHLSSHAQLQPKFFVIDYSMPLCDGPGLITWLRRNRYDQVPAFILSTSTLARHRSECVQLGANDYFAKPQSHAELKFLVTEMFRQVETL